MTKMPVARDLSGLKQHAAERELFVRFLNYLQTAKPLVPVKANFAGYPKWWTNRILAGEQISECIGLWGQIFTGIAWDRRGVGNEASYGAAFLQLYGHVGEALHRYGDLTIDLSTMLMAMVDLQPKPLVVRFGHKGRRWWVEPTEHGESVLRLRGRVVLPREVPAFDVPQQLFDEIYGSGGLSWPVI